MVPFCTVCAKKMPSNEARCGRGGGPKCKRQRFGANEDAGDSVGGVVLPPINEDGSTWAFTTERTSVSQIQIIFKLFEILKSEFAAGYLCSECMDYVEQIDSLQFQTQALIKAFKQRVDFHCDGRYEEDSFDDGIREEEMQSTATPVRTKSGRISTKKLPSGVFVKKKQASASTKKQGNSNGDGKVERSETVTVKVEDVRILRPSHRATSSSTENDSKSSRVAYKNEFWGKVNDPEFVKAVLAKQNFDYDVSVVTTTHNTEHLIYDACIWHPASSKEFRTDNYVAKWLCGKCHSFSYKCLARIATTADKACVIVESKYMEHNHDLDPEEVRNALFKNRVKEIAINHPEMTPIRVLKTVEMLDGDFEMPHDKPSHGCILKYISRVQERYGIPKKPRERKPGYVPRKRKTPLLKVKQAEDEDQQQQDQNMVQEIVIVQQEGEATSQDAPREVSYEAPPFNVEYIGHVVN